jgi:hypothetical protein
MKKTCGGCRALRYDFKCDLLFKNSPVWFGGIGGIKISATPIEECPKPKTIQDYNLELRIKNRKQ